MASATCDRCGAIGNSRMYTAISLNGELYPLCLGCTGELGVWWSSLEGKEVTDHGDETEGQAEGDQQADEAEEGEAVRVLNGDGAEPEAEVEAAPDGREEEEG